MSHLMRHIPRPESRPQGVLVPEYRALPVLRPEVPVQAKAMDKADIRALRKPDVYKQKGIRYADERLRKKAGKTGA